MLQTSHKYKLTLFKKKNIMKGVPNANTPTNNLHSVGTRLLSPIWFLPILHTPPTVQKGNYTK